MSEIYSRQHGLTYSSSGTFIKKKERRKELKETRDLRYVYQNELGKACFQHDMAYGDFKDLPRRTAVDKVLRDKSYNIAKKPKYDEYQKVLASIVYKFLDKNSLALRTWSWNLVSSSIREVLLKMNYAKPRIS